MPRLPASVSWRRPASCGIPHRMPTESRKTTLLNCCIAPYRLQLLTLSICGVAFADGRVGCALATMITSTRRWLRRNRTNFAIGAGVLGAGYLAGQYVLGKLSEVRQRASEERIAKEKYVNAS
jgi:hypothetical protein